MTRTFNLADLFEITATTVPERVALVAGHRRLTYAELNERATRFAGHLRSVGVLPGEHVAVLSWNRAEWIEAMLGTFGARAVPINVNYRYTTDEVVSLLHDSESVALVVERSLLDSLGGVEAISGPLPVLRHVVVIDGDDHAPVGGTTVIGYERALTGAAAVAGPVERSGDDHYILYTGGTTGSPKGVVWRAEDIFFAALGGGNPGGDPITAPDELAANISDRRQPWLVTSPMMHGNGQWNSLVPLLTGRGVVLWTGHRFDAAAIAELAEREAVQLLVLVGDGMAIPFVDAVAERSGTAAVLPDLRAIGSGGAVLSPTAKARLASLLPHVTVIDGFGASETGSNGRLVGTGDGGPPRFVMGPDTVVLDDELQPAAVGVVGRLARCGHVPLGYWNDPEKSAATFPTDAAGVRWAVPGDFARLEDDGTITLLGRGSACINTGGEKVHPEEVAIAVKSHPDVSDAVVVGAPDERFGQRVVALIVPRDGTEPGVDDLRAHLRGSLAGYKLPRSVVPVNRLEYTAQGKPDLRWAADFVATALTNKDRIQ